MKKRLVIVAGCVLLVALMLTSVAYALTSAKENLGSPQTGVKSKTVTGKKGGTLTLIYGSSPTCPGTPWSPQHAWADGQIGRFCVENLIGLDKNGNPIPQLATSWTVKRSAKTITFNLRKGVKFQDGTDFNAAAAKWCLDKYRTGGKADLKSISAVNVTGPYQVQLVYTQYNPLLIQQMSSNYSGRMVAQSSTALHPIGTGPFMWDSYQSNVAVHLKKWSGYWQKGLPYLDGVDINIVADKTVAATSFQKGEGQSLYDVAPTKAAELKSGGAKIDKLMTSIWCITGDSKNSTSKWADINFRRGIAYALPTAKMVAAASHGYWAATNQLAVKGMQAYNPAIKGYPYNVAKAKALLAQAGVSTSSPVTIPLVYMQNDESTQYVTMIQGYLSQVGVNITPKPLITGAFYGFVKNPWKNQLLMMAFSYNGIEMQYSTSAATNLSATATSNVSVATPDAYNAKLQDALYQPSATKREKDYEAMNKVLIDDDCTIVPQFGYRVLNAKSPKVKNFYSACVTNVEFLPEIAYLK